MFIDHFDLTQPLVFPLIEDVASEAECQALIQSAEQGQWLKATVNSAEGRVVNERLRSNTLALIDDEPLAKDLFERIRSHVPAKMKSMEVVGLKPRMRCYRYGPGQSFGLHHDQFYSGGPGERSQLTFMLYLNEDFEGGHTDFPDQQLVVKPKTGAVLLFQHMVLHEGAAVRSGVKYVLRTDVLYRTEAAPSAGTR